MNKHLFLGCDWGTTTFRLRLFNILDQKVLGEIVTSDGIAVLFNAWESNGGNHFMPKEQYFRQQLKKQINALSELLDLNLDNIPVVISGMASSSIGMRVVDYADLPFPLDGTNALFAEIPADQDFKNEILLIAGVKTDDDVMRGEETQAIGLMSVLQQQGIWTEKAMLILPGTHSKHIHIQGNEVVDFKTFMTGEFFDILSKHSILKDSVDNQKSDNLSDEDLNAFKKGIHVSSNNALLHNVFSVRTNQLFDHFDKSQNSNYLSGLLIGSELRTLLGDDETPIILCCNNHLQTFYALALEELGLLKRTNILSSDIIDKATIAGQWQILNQAINPIK